MPIDYVVDGILCTNSDKRYEVLRDMLDCVGVRVVQDEPEPQKGVGDPTLAVNGSWYDGEQAIARYMVERVRILGIDSDSS